MTHFQEYIGLLPQDSLHTQPSYLRLYRAYLSQVPPEDLKGISATILQDHVDGLWALIQDRPTHSGPRIHTYHVGTSLTCINIINDDMPFLVDSVTAAINTFGYPVELLIHPVLSVKRSASGHLEDRRNPVRWGILGICHAGTFAIYPWVQRCYGPRRRPASGFAARERGRF